MAWTQNLIIPEARLKSICHKELNCYIKVNVEVFVRVCLRFHYYKRRIS